MLFGSASPKALASGVPRVTGEFPLIQGARQAAGYRIPAGWGARWYPGRDASAIRLVEAALFGNSTEYGQTDTGPYYSPLQRAVERLVAAGYTDGGHGNLNGPDDVTSPGESMSRVGFAKQNAFVLPGESNFSDAGGDSITATRVGRYLTIWYSRFNSGGRFTYEIDNSGVEVPVDPAYPNPGGIHTFAHTARIDMGTTGTHTIVIRNKGGRIVNAPVYTGGTGNGSGTGGSLAAGTYDYAAAFVAPDGKIGPLGPTRTITIATGQTYGLGLLAQPEAGGTTTNLYRRVAGTGTFKLVATAATNSGSPYNVNDTGAAGTTDYAQSTAPVLNSSMSYVNVATVVTRATGIVLHNLSARGSSSAMASSPYNAAIGMGLDLEPQTNVAAADRTVDSASGALKPDLVILAHGINDQQQSSADNSTAYRANLVAAIRAAKVAGADVLVVLPCWETANQQQNASLYRAAGKSAAESEGAAWVDVGIAGALPGVVPGATTNPHLTKAQYQAQGDYIWDQVLGLT